MNFLKKVFNNIQLLLIVVLIIIIIMIKSCDEKTIEPQVITKIKTEYIPIEKKVPQYIPKWKIRIESKINTDTFLVHIDTSAVLKDYYSKYYYEDTLSLDTLGYILVKDTISKNNITSRNVDYKVYIPKITIEKTTLINRREFYIGFGSTGNFNQINYVGTEILYKTKNKQLFGLGIGINQNLIPVISGRIYWKIGK